MHPLRIIFNPETWEWRFKLFCDGLCFCLGLSLPPLSYISYNMLPELKVLLSISEIKNRLITEINQDTIKRLKGQEGTACAMESPCSQPGLYWKPPPLSLVTDTQYTQHKNPALLFR